MMLSAFEAKNTEYYLKMKKEGKVQFRQFSDDILDALRKFTDETISEITSSDVFAKKVYDSYMNFKKNIYEWNLMAEKNYKVT